MIKWILLVALITTAAFAAQEFSTNELCEGFVPQNNMRIPVGFTTGANVTEADFNSVLDRIATMYTEEVASHGGRLMIKRLWTDGTVNASAQRSNGTWYITMYGGLARHQAVTLDGFTLAACHEMGHHLGGAPKIDGWFSTWATNEGGSDYYATLKCLRRFWENDDNEKILSTMQLNPIAVKECNEMHLGRLDQLLCIRNAEAGMSVAMLFQDLRKNKSKVNFDTPDPSQVTRTDDNHPASQCRLDTYYAGALCTAVVADGVSDDDYRAGSCADSNRFKKGLRPRCWFAPDAAPLVNTLMNTLANRNLFW